IARASTERGTECAQGVVGIRSVPVEKVFGVVDDLASLRDEVADRVLDHREVLLERRAEDFRDVQGPGLPDERHHGHAAVEQGPEFRILIGPGAGAAGRAEGGEAGVLELQLAGLVEEGDVAGIRSRKAALDVVDAECIEPLRDQQLVGHGEADPLPLRSVAEGGVVNLHCSGVHDRDSRLGGSWFRKTKNPGRITRGRSQRAGVSYAQAASSSPSWAGIRIIAAIMIERSTERADCYGGSTVVETYLVQAVCERSGSEVHRRGRGGRRGLEE